MCWLAGLEAPRNSDLDSPAVNVLITMHSIFHSLMVPLEAWGSNYVNKKSGDVKYE